VLWCGVLVAGLAYVYYPPVDQIFADMRGVQADTVVAVLQRKREVAIRGLKSWDAMAAKLPISAFLRFAPPSGQARAATAEFRRTLEDAENAVARGTRQDARRLTMQVCDACDRCRKAYLSGGSAPVVRRVKPRSS
jgi:hypothetical protein